MKLVKNIDSGILPHLKRIAIHIIFWLSYLLYHTFLFGYMRQDFFYPFKWELYDLPLKILASYFVAYVLIPKYLFTKKIWHFMVSLAFALLAASFFAKGFS